MTEEVKKPRRQRSLECPILRAAKIPLPPRVECCVFGCRNSDRDRVSFHSLPQEPARWTTWLKLINRQDLADRLRSGNCTAVICSAHFLPEQTPGGVLETTAQPTLQLPRTCHEFVYDGSSGLLSVQVKPELEEDIIEIKLETDELPTQNFHEKSTAPDQCNEHRKERNHSPERSNLKTVAIHLDQTPEQTYQLHQNPDINLPDPEISLIIEPIKSEPEYLDFQVNAGSQTNVTEAFNRIATFSAVEQINIASTGTRLNDVSSRSTYAQTTPELVEVFSKDLKQKYALLLDEANNQLKSIERPQLEKLQFLKGCDQYLDEKISNFIKSHAYLSNKYIGKYPVDFQSFALKLYLLNPKSYKFVEKFFDLPSKCSIERFRMPVNSGVNQCLMEAFKVKIDQMSARGKMCVVCFDVMRLKKNIYYDVSHDYLCGMQEIGDVVEQKPAEYAAMIAVRGLYSRWKQPVSFAFVAEKRKHLELQSWLHKTIVTLFDMGLNVKVLVTNSDDEFLDVAMKEPFLVQNERKICNIHDVPDLFKSARDELMQYDFHIGDSIAKWEHILSVFDHDKEQDMTLMPNITEKHVRPDATVKNDVKLATQLFSSSTAAAMHFYVVAGLQEEQTKCTVQFISKMSALFDILYSRKLDCAYRATPAQQRFLKDSLAYLQTIKLKDRHGIAYRSKFVSGLTKTITSLMFLIADLKKSNMNYLLTKNLSKDFMQPYFDEARRLHSKPTPIVFTRAFRRLYLSSLLSNTKMKATGDDMMLTLAKIAEYVKADMEKQEIDPASLSIGVTDYKISWPSHEYIAGYLMSKCLERHLCDKLIENLCDYYKFEYRRKAELIEAFRFYNAENTHKLCKLRPPTQLRQFVNYMDVKYNENYRRPDVKSLGFGWSLYCVIENDSFELPCPCFPVKFLKMLYIRLRIYNSVKKYKNNIKKKLKQ